MKKCSFCGQPETTENKVIVADKVGICKSCIDVSARLLDLRTIGIQLDLIEEMRAEAQGEVKLLEKKAKTDFSKFEVDWEKVNPKTLKTILDKSVIGQDKAKKTLSVAVYNHYKRLLKKDEMKVDVQKSNVLMIGPTGSGKTLLAQTIAKEINVPLAISDATSLTEAGYIGDDVETVLSRLYSASGEDLEATERGIVFIDEIDKLARSTTSKNVSRDVGGSGVQQALLKIIEGAKVNVPVGGARKHPQKEQIEIDTTNILFICAGAFSGLETVIEKRMNVSKIGYNDEEEEKETTFNDVDTDDIIKYGFNAELLGRLPMVTSLEKITLDVMRSILTKPSNAITKQYQALFDVDGVKLKFSTTALNEIARRAMERETGARALRSIIEEVMLDVMFHLRDYENKTVTLKFLKGEFSVDSKDIELKNKEETPVEE